MENSVLPGDQASTDPLSALKQRYQALRQSGGPKTKSAGLENLYPQLAAAIQQGWQKIELWQALRTVGYPGGYGYFAQKLERLGLRRRAASLLSSDTPPPNPAAPVSDPFDKLRTLDRAATPKHHLQRSDNTPTKRG